VGASRDERSRLTAPRLPPQVFRFLAWLAGAEARDVVEAANRATHRGELKAPSEPLPEGSYRLAASRAEAEWSRTIGSRRANG
jgi:hypothetical protein